MSWEGGSTDFSFDGDDDKSPIKLKVDSERKWKSYDFILITLSKAIILNSISKFFTGKSLVGSERIEFSIFAMSRRRHNP